VNLRDENVLREMNLYPLWVRKEMPASENSPAHPDPSTSLRTEGDVEGQEVVSATSNQTATSGSEQASTSSARTDKVVVTTPASGWSELKAQVKDCTACKLRAGCTQTVFGVGDEDADWLFVGEGPGAEEDERGEPFVGQAGKLLDNMLTSIKLKRGNKVYIANVVKCRPPNNRAPEADEVATCLPYLKQQIAHIKPKLIVALGKTAATSLLGKEATLGSMRGTLHDFEGTPLLVTYHPAYLLRSPAEKTKAWQDLRLAVSTMQGL
jgi:DNA polymerase